MKKLLAIIAAMLAIINVAYAYDFESGGIYYNITSSSTSDNAVKVTFGNTKYSGKVVIPKTVTLSDTDTDTDTEYTVTSIGSRAFYDCQSLTNIELPTSLSEIEENAFRWL
jgi:hypothetical protein